MAKWYESAYRRVVVDMHISDHDERFMSQFEPTEYVEMLKGCGAQSTIVPTHSHAGLCYFPTEVGEMHGGLGGRDVFGEVVDLCRDNGIPVVAYLSGIFDTWAYRQHPDWRIVDVEGNEAGANSRYGVCCPNSPYRDYIADLTGEVCGGYQVDGVRFDMTFWPRVCYCRHCTMRFGAEVGRELPTTIDWTDPHWVTFQRKREEWLLDFAGLLTDTAKNCCPELSVEHQASTYASDWSFGVTHRLAERCDFLQGDFYGDALEGSFVRKLFSNLSPNLPFGFETSVSVDLNNYTALKSKELLEAKASASIADGGAFVFIDSVDPPGTLNPAARRRMQEVFDAIAPYESYVGGEPIQDVAVYLSTESKCNFADNGEGVGSAGDSRKSPHVEAALGACKALIEHHIPFGVITKNSLQALDDHAIVVLPNVLMMDDEEVAAFGEYVREGGNLYASKYTSLTDKAGYRRDGFMLGDVFGAVHQGQTEESFTYLVPVEGEGEVLREHTERHPAGVADGQIVLAPQPDADVLATLGLPYTDPSDPQCFASIHSNPPGRYPPNPTIVMNRFGDGRCVYVAADIERHAPHAETFIRLLRRMHNGFSFAAEAPKCVEVTAFRQPERGRHIISLVNFQAQLPNVPVHDIRVRVRIGECRPARLLVLPTEGEHEFTCDNGIVEFTAPRLDTLLVFGLQLEREA